MRASGQDVDRPRDVARKVIVIRPIRAATGPPPTPARWSSSISTPSSSPNSRSRRVSAAVSTSQSIAATVAARAIAQRAERHGNGNGAAIVIAATDYQ